MDGAPRPLVRPHPRQVPAASVHAHTSPECVYIPAPRT
ncbi:hypothetical protein SGL43_04971 [Streptomyces globisporus]|uniref:Uncharacterized protein n=1 Tax=Streptomyces globisporus TaxID=1908 RepID=A0ABN8V714_STRGL|nr:hypothetical protein SGL43_04971 [Streptomyces globisporus]